MLPAGDSRMEWTLRLVGMGIDGQSRSFEVMTISRRWSWRYCQPGYHAVRSKAAAGASSAAGYRRSGHHPCDVSAGLPVVWRDMWRERLAGAPNRDAVRRGETEASAVSVRWLRLWRDRCQLAIALSVDI
jgi:hypothetical protein